MKVRVVLHIHTNFSHDSNVTAKQIINQCRANQIDYIGITDHCTTKGAEAFKQNLEANGIKVIIGEEIMTKSGEIIGLFLNKNIACKKNGKKISLKRAIEQIKEQKGLVFVPHPFDKMRHGIGLKNITKYRKHFDAYEVFNSRTKISHFNKKAQKFVNQNGLIPFIGSDAHISREIPNAIMEMESFDTKEEFLKNLSKRKSIVHYKKRFKLIDIIRPTINKFKKRILGKNVH